MVVVQLILQRFCQDEDCSNLDDKDRGQNAY